MPPIKRNSKQSANTDAAHNDPSLSVLQSLAPPNSIEAEQAVIGGILFSPDVFNKVVEFLKADDFYRPSHRLVFKAMSELSVRSEPIDIITVSEWLNDNDSLEPAGGRTYLMDLAMSVATAENAVYYARIIRNKSLLRQLITAGNDIASSCYELQE